METAILILAHKNPQQLARLCNAVDHPGTRIFVHLDAKADMGEFVGIKNAEFLKKRFDVRWGGFSMVRAWMSAFEEIENSGYEYQWLHLLSGQDYPVRTMEAIDRELTASPGKNYISGFPVDPVSEAHKKLRRRYERYHMFVDRRLPRIICYLAVNALHPCKRKPPASKVYKGSAWFTLTRECIRYILDYCTGHPEYVRAFRATSCPDEMFFHTLIMNSPLADTVVPYRRFIKWVEGNPSPETLTVADYEDMVASGCWFARKFEADDPVLDLLPVAPATRE